MPARILTVNSQVQCVHGAPAILTTTNTSASASSGLALVEGIEHVVAGCPFTIGLKPSPCVRIRWSVSTTFVTVGNKAVLTEDSIGECISPEGAVQGLALKMAVQTKAVAQ